MDPVALLARLTRVLAAALPTEGAKALRDALTAAGFAGGELGPDAPEGVRQSVGHLFELAERRAITHDELLRSRERAEMLSEASFEGIMIHVDGVLIDANQRLCELSGYSFSEVLGPDFMRRCLVPEDLAGVMQRVRDRVTGDYIVTVVRKDGTHFRAEILSKQGMLGERPVRVAAVRDVTERERITGLVRESESRLRELASATFDLLTYSRDGVMVDFVGDVESFFGTPRDELIGRRIVDVVAPDVRDLVRTHVETRQSGAFRSVILTDSGERIPVEIVAVATTLDGIPARLAGIRDLRETERVENERRRLEQHLQQSQRLDSLGVLAGGIAHDFNNLLVGILGSAELLAQSDLRPEDRESVRAITEAGERAATLTAQLLAYAGRRDLGQREPIDLSALLGELLRLLTPTLSKKADLRLAIEPGSIVLGNRATVLQVLMNLLTNASDALGGNAGAIHVTARRVAEPDARFKHALGSAVTAGDKAFILIEVRDTGVGMDETTRTRIFEPFFSTKAKGHGLGLAACLGIVASHGGAIVVESAPGQGSTFSVLLPAAEATGKPAGRQERGATLAARILVVDDEAIVRKQVRRILESQGYAVIDAGDGTTALELIERERPSLVLLDVTMPGLDGTEVVQEARRRGHTMPIVLFSGYADFPLEQRLEPSMYQGFLAKPFGIDALLALIKKSLHP